MLSDVLTRPTVLVGDLVGSRDAPSRSALHAVMKAALDVANRHCRPAEPLSPTIGDEFQAVFHSLADALLATVVVRAGLSSGNDARFGLGVGDVVTLERQGEVHHQDGPGWWAARDAIDYVASGRRAVPGTLRTWVAVAPPDPGGQVLPVHVESVRSADARAVNAFLATRDHLVSDMDDRDRRILLGLLLGRSMTDIAAREGISVSAVSQRSHRSGAAQVVFAHAGLA